MMVLHVIQGTYNDRQLSIFLIAFSFEIKNKNSYRKSLTAIFTVFICVTMDTDKLNNKNKIYIYSRSQMKMVLMHRKMDHWTGYSSLADSCAAITSFSQNFLLTVYSKSYCHLTYG